MLDFALLTLKQNFQVSPPSSATKNMRKFKLPSYLQLNIITFIYIYLCSVMQKSRYMKPQAHKKV